MTLINTNRRLTHSKTTNFYYSFVFLPPEKRRAIEAVYAFARRGDDLVDGPLPSDEARRGLELYRADLNSCFAGQSAELASRSPEMPALATSIRRFQIPRQPFDDLICGLEMDLAKSRYETFEELEVYCYRVASTIGLMAIEIFGYANPSAKDYAVHLGKALQMVNILRDIRRDAERGRTYLPIEDLKRFGVSPQSLLDGKPEGRFPELIEFEAARAETFFRIARQGLAEEDRKAMTAAEIMAATYWRLLGRIRCGGEGILRRRVRLSRPLRIWTALSVYAGAEWWQPESRH